MSTNVSQPYLRWVALAVLLSGAFVTLVDFFIVNIALPSIRQSLGASFAQMQLVVVGYGLAYAVLLVTGGRLGDTYGRKRIFLLALLLFTAASALCGAATSGRFLVGARLLQGGAAALLMPQTIASLHATFDGQDRERAFVLFGAVMGGAMIAGLVLGGAFVRADILGFGWRPIFWVNVPVGLAAAAVGMVVLKDSRKPEPQLLDLSGVLSLTVALALVFYPLVQGPSSGWPLWATVSLAVGCFALVAFVAIERATAARGGFPLLSVDLFCDRNFVWGLTVIVVFFLGPAGFFLLLTFYLQIVAGLDPLAASLAIAPFAIGFLIASYVTPALKRRIDSSILLLAAVVMLIAVAWLALTIGMKSVIVTPLDILPPMFVLGLGQGLLTSPLYEILLRDVSARTAGTASGLFSTVQLATQCVSVAVVAMVFALFLHRASAVEAGRVVAQVRSSLASSGMSVHDSIVVTRQLSRCLAFDGNVLFDGAQRHCQAMSTVSGMPARLASAAWASSVKTAFLSTLGFYAAVLIGTALLVSVFKPRLLPKPS